MVLKLDYFTISRVIRPRKRWRQNENDWHMECKRPHFSYDLESLMKRKKCWNKKCLRKYAHMGECKLSDIQRSCNSRRIDDDNKHP